MPKDAQLITRILSGLSDANIDFRDLCKLLRKLGFEERIRGDHHIFTRSNVREIINVQPIGAHAKAYQVKQIRGIILEYRLGDEPE